MVGQETSLCLCMIAKDEEDCIGQCIKSVRDIAQEIVVVDTGSADRTAAIAEELGARVLRYAWDDSFANARNFAMRQAQSEWLLLLDADETLDEASKPALLAFVRTTSLDGAHVRVRNYTGKYSPDQYSLHTAMRLIRNHAGYYFHGDIHEQITCDEAADIAPRFAALDVTVHHFGYLDDVVRRKDKRKRNMPILEKQLRDHPGEPFTLFNLGNEYLALQDHRTALSYYRQSLEKLENRRIAFAPHLFFRMASCHSALRDQDAALRVIAQGLRQYPRCTDLEFLRGDILHRQKRYTLAIDSFEACLQMGAPPSALELLPGCGTFRAAFELGGLYLELEDFARAAKYETAALSFKPDLYAALYRLGKAFSGLYEDRDEVEKKLFACFADPGYCPNALVGADILAGEGLYPQALHSLEGITDTEGREAEIAYVRGKTLLCMGERGSARETLLAASAAPGEAGRILRGVPLHSAMLLLILALQTEDEPLAGEALRRITAYGGKHAGEAAKLLIAIRRGETPEDPHFEDEGRAELAFLTEAFGILLKCRAFALFDTLQRALNYIDAKEVLLCLANLFEENNFHALACEHVLRSVRELDAIDETGAGILFRRLSS